MSAKTIDFHYSFTFENQQELKFDIRLDGNTLNLIQGESSQTSPWARLENHQCPNCTLRSGDHPYCPIALNLLDLLMQFNDMYSYENVYVQVQTKERLYAARVSVQNGLSALLGIYMVTSGCPIMSRLKPMVRFHLPFATVEETIYRSVSTYLLGQYYRYRDQREADWSLSGLRRIYEDIQIVNVAMAGRLRSIAQKDANVNALIVLDIFAKQLPLSIDESLKRLEYLFQ